jgi:hypothetical protein
MESARKPKRRRQPPLGLEALEERWIPSALPLVPSLGYAGPVEVVEWDVTTEQVDHDDVIVQADVPAAVVARLRTRYPGAEWRQVEFSRDDGQPTFHVTMSVSGQAIDVAVSPDGRILETEQTLSLSAVPQPLLDWVRQVLPGAALAEAYLVSDAGVSYEVLITTADGQAIEATVRLRAPTSELGDVHAKADAGLGEAAASPAASVAVVRVVATLPQAAANADAVTPPPSTSAASIARGGAEATVASQPARMATLVQANAAELSADGFDAIALEQTARELASATDALARTWLPQVAGVFSDLLPLDASAVEQRLECLLAEIDALVATATPGTVARNWAARSALTAAIIAAAGYVYLETKRARPEPVLVSRLTSTSWSWLLGAETINPS